MNTFIKKYIGGKRFWKSAATLAVPIALQNLLTSSFTLVDTLMVGQLGDVALSSVGMAGQWSWLLNIVTFGVCSGAAVFVSQYWGAKDIKGIHKVTGLSAIIGIFISLVFLLAGFFFPKTVVGIFNKDLKIISQGSIYLVIACFSYPGVVLNTILGAILRATENVKLPVFTALFTTLLNAFLDYAMIFGAFRFPEMGVAGAALATCISAWVGPVILLVASLIQKNILCAPIKELLGFDKKLIKRFSKTAAPVVINESLWGLGTFLFNVIFANLGYENYAAVTILKTIENLAYAFFIGLCNACCVMVGKNIGAGNFKESVDDARRFGIIIPLMGLVVGIFIIILRPYLIGLFNVSGELTQKSLQAAMIITMLYAIELPVRNISYTFIVGIFRSGGDTINGAKIDILSLWCVALPLTFIFAFIIKAPFPLVFAMMYIGEDYIKTYLCIKHFNSYRWIKPVTSAGRERLEAFLTEVKYNKK